MSTSSREYSPDWLRNVQAPPSILMLSSSSESIPNVSEDDDDDDQLPISSVTKKTSQVTSPSKNLKRLADGEGEDIKGGRKVTKRKTPEKPTKPQAAWALSSDSEYEEEEDKLKFRLKMEDIKTKGTKEEKDKDLERETTEEKQTGPYVSSSRLPLVLADKVQRSKALVECEGESIDLSGDLGSVGRVVISEAPSGNQDVLLDLKGTIYKMEILPSRTFCVVSFGQTEAKIEAIMNDFIQLKPQSNVYETETMMEGTLEGYSFDSEDEGDNRQTGGDDQQTKGGGDEQPQTKGKPGRKKQPGAAKKKGKAAAKKVNRKAPAAKKSKAKK